MSTHANAALLSAASATTMVGPKNPANPATPKQSSKMHRRSRTGCYVCRLRRKKCDEGKSTCKACKHLGLKCEYKRPMWWSNNEQRKQQKENIKNIIRRTKLSEKTVQLGVNIGGESPPDLSHSLPTSSTFSDSLDRTRSVSVDSQFSLEYDFNQGVGFEGGYNAFNPQMQAAYYAPPYGNYSPYEVDVKTERQMYVNDVPTRRDSSISTFNTFQPPPPPPPPPHATLPSFPAEAWPQDIYDGRPSPLGAGDDGLDMNIFNFSHAPVTTQQAMVHVDECDRGLLDHFVDNVLRLIFPVLEVNQHGSARSEVILPALETNKCYLHCCLSISALHLKTTQGLQGDQIDNDIMRHRYATISELCEALNRDTDHMQILEATLGMIFFQCSVGRPDDCLPDIPWHQHFQAVSSLVHKLELPHAVSDLSQCGGPAQTPFNMTLASWIDILGATMLGRAPQFADNYRERNLASSSSGLSELMGCEDRVMYLISEIACLDGLKIEGMDDVQLISHIHSLAQSIGTTEQGARELCPPYSSTGILRPGQLSKNMTAVFRLAARIYLCSLVPGFDNTQSNIVDLVSMLAECLEYIPSGPEGFDRSLVWPLLIGGSASMRGSFFRQTFQSRVERLGDKAEFGSFGRMNRLLREVWRQSDEQRQNVHWRDVMQQKGWNYLLI
ncbi:MAG: hypothetical protein M1825_000171 [Sarcosagium campestre]|nr:MAG: hypothetical protein M1825_000171 [Sarcosagium campestre]